MSGRLIDRDACRCRSCRARDRAEFERIVSAFATIREAANLWVVWPETDAIVERIDAYTFDTKGDRA